MYGDAENPLFDARTVLIDILGYEKLSKCRFYKDYKKDDRFVKKIGGIVPLISENT